VQHFNLHDYGGHGVRDDFDADPANHASVESFIRDFGENSVSNSESSDFLHLARILELISDKRFCPIIGTSRT
jgi:hypothetical protein